MLIFLYGWGEGVQGGDGFSLTDEKRQPCGRLYPMRAWHMWRPYMGKNVMFGTMEERLKGQSSARRWTVT